ncbi:hypothetical protein RZS08_03150, partial [Arthrospira platensis SPKY1]|nr:hypothetical protein [Arthrospira platensis SPKY1]
MNNKFNVIAYELIIVARHKRRLKANSQLPCSKRDLKVALRQAVQFNSRLCARQPLAHNGRANPDKG